MTSPELDNLVKIGKLKREPPSDEETAGLLRSAEERLNDACRTDLSYASRFDLAYNAAHALALVALRRAGYRSDNRYLVFQALSTLSAWPRRSGASWRKRTNDAIWPSTKGTSSGVPSRYLPRPTPGTSPAPTDLSQRSDFSKADVPRCHSAITLA